MYFVKIYFEKNQLDEIRFSPPRYFHERELCWIFEKSNSTEIFIFDMFWNKNREVTIS